MKIELTTYYQEREVEFNKVIDQQWSDTWGATPADALKLCAMAFSSMFLEGRAAIEFMPVWIDDPNKPRVHRLPGKDYHNQYLGVQGIGFVHHAYMKALAQEEELRKVKQQLAEATQVLLDNNLVPKEI